MRIFRDKTAIITGGGVPVTLNAKVPWWLQRISPKLAISLGRKVIHDSRRRRYQGST